MDSHIPQDLVYPNIILVYVAKIRDNLESQNPSLVSYNRVKSMPQLDILHDSWMDEFKDSYQFRTFTTGLSIVTRIFMDDRAGDHPPRRLSSVLF